MGRPSGALRTAGCLTSGARWSATNLNPEGVRDKSRRIRRRSNGSQTPSSSTSRAGELTLVPARVGGRRLTGGRRGFGEGCSWTRRLRQVVWYRRRGLGWPGSSARSGDCGGDLRPNSGEGGGYPARRGYWSDQRREGSKMVCGNSKGEGAFYRLEGVLLAMDMADRKSVV